MGIRTEFYALLSSCHLCLYVRWPPEQTEMCRIKFWNQKNAAMLSSQKGADHHSASPVVKGAEASRSDTGILSVRKYGIEPQL